MEYFYIYEMKNNEIIVRPHRFNPRGDYTNRQWDYVDCCNQMRSLSDDKVQLYIELLTQKLSRDIIKERNNIKKLENNIDNMLETQQQLYKLKEYK